MGEAGQPFLPPKESFSWSHISVIPCPQFFKKEKKTTPSCLLFWNNTLVVFIKSLSVDVISSRNNLLVAAENDGENKFSGFFSILTLHPCLLRVARGFYVEVRVPLSPGEKELTVVA